MNTDHYFDRVDALEVEKYHLLSNDSLLCYALDRLLADDVPATFENITVIAFRLFPRSFCLVGHPAYPDAARVNRTLLHARPKYRDLVVGSAKNGYTLTKKGTQVARQTAIDLEGSHNEFPAPEHPTEKSTSRRTYTGHNVIQAIEGSSLFAHWRNDECKLIDEYELWEFLSAAPYTEKAVLRAIMKKYREAAALSSRDDVQDFLAWVERRYRRAFHGDRGE